MHLQPAAAGEEGQEVLRHHRVLQLDLVAVRDQHLITAHNAVMAEQRCHLLDPDTCRLDGKHTSPHLKQACATGALARAARVAYLLSAPCEHTGSAYAATVQISSSATMTMGIAAERRRQLPRTFVAVGSATGATSSSWLGRAWSRIRINRWSPRCSTPYSTSFTRGNATRQGSCGRSALTNRDSLVMALPAKSRSSAEGYRTAWFAHRDMRLVHGFVSE